MRALATKCVVIGVVALVLATAASAQLTVCVPAGDAAERAELVTTLTGLGFSIENLDDPSAGTCAVALTFPGGGGSAAQAWVDAGHGLVQISDHGPGYIANAWTSVAEGSAHTVTVADPTHPITSGLPASWSGRGFWAYGDGQDYLGWANAGPNLIRVDSYDRALSVATSGSGRLVYLGWNVFGTATNANDIEVLRRSILWAGNQTMPAAASVPALGTIGLAAAVLLLLGAAILLLRRG